MKKFGIDVSRWQGSNFDFKRAKEKEGVEFAILKIGGADGGLYHDKEFTNYYAKCKAISLPVGAYFFGHALTLDQAKKEAQYLISLLKGYKFEYPIFYDVEGDMVTKVNKRLLTDIIKTVLKTVQDAGYWVGLYGSATYLHTQVYDDELKNFSHWGASWGSTKPTYMSGAELQMWQFGGEVNVIRSNKICGTVCDQDYCYVDYPTLIKAKGLNGYSKTKTNTNTKTVEQLAREVIAGKWGSGQERKDRLTKAGYDYSAVQKKVNEVMR